MISTGSMVQIGKAYQNLMVDVQQTNEKLVTRAQNIVMAATECTRDEAIAALEQAGGHVKTAVVMIMAGLDAEGAAEALAGAAGHVREAIAPRAYHSVAPPGCTNEVYSKVEGKSQSEEGE